MVDQLRVRAYNVRFGDAVLVSIPDIDDVGDPVTRHMMVDFGNALASQGGVDDVFDPILDDVLSVTDGAPLDLFVMTHEHLDHVQGPLFASEKSGRELTANVVWMPKSTEPGYYDNFPDARQKKLELEAVYETIAEMVGRDAGHPTLNTMMLNNNPRRTKDCVEKIRSLTADGSEPVYVHRELPDVDEHHPFNRATIKLWAPEEDTSIYYGRFKRMVLGLAGSTGGDAGSAVGRLTPPPGVDAGAFFDLADRRRTGLAENLFTIDKASNNSSVVFSLHWEGWSLLFSGDAEERSWKEMNKRQLLEPVHFLKVSHHGSHNGTPDDELLDQLLPIQPPDDRARKALVSTHPDAYPESVPDQITLDAIKERVDELHTTESVEPGRFVDLFFLAN